MATDFPSSQSIGHIPQLGACMACGYSNNGGREPMAHEPCGDQAKARDLLDRGYAPLPSSPEDFDRLVEMAKRYG